jgi:hypothetical protein
MKWPTFLMVPRAPDFTIGPRDDLYLRRWWLIPRARWFNVYLHHFRRSDDNGALHDHKSHNISLLLRGSYREHLMGGIVKLRRPWRPIFRKPTTAHRVELIDGKPVWTLFITGRPVRNWGFWCKHGWVPWEKYVAVRPGGNEMGDGCGE